MFCFLVSLHFTGCFFLYEYTPNTANYQFWAIQLCFCSFFCCCCDSTDHYIVKATTPATAPPIIAGRLESDVGCCCCSVSHSGSLNEEIAMNCIFPFTVSAPELQMSHPWYYTVQCSSPVMSLRHVQLLASKSLHQGLKNTQMYGETQHKYMNVQVIGWEKVALFPGPSRAWK